MTIGDCIATEALTLVGTPFRLRGRDPRTGLDCVGLVLTAARRAGLPACEPPVYRLHGTSRRRAELLLRSNGLVPVDHETPGDILLVESGPMQLHLMVCASAGHVHAHAGLGRVVLMPPPAPWPVLGIWRVSPGANPQHGDTDFHDARHGAGRPHRRRDRRVGRAGGRCADLQAQGTNGTEAE